MPHIILFIPLAPPMPGLITAFPPFPPLPPLLPWPPLLLKKNEINLIVILF
jgi:hypothetical protein